ncbi:hypothetical protein Zmor_001615 [Zophobas morio]|uniref:DUF4806 domain-containing protein n=1 Tax=Zophobas morio TaxID=2755281 RepID=A0AA38J5I1_9CUCU|nr:hypothetical protein Zmor_001615 [Zophobas morio]
MKKPSDVSQFLNEFVQEFKFLELNGLEVGKTKIFPRISKIICDAPAKAFILGVKGYHGCTKCIDQGEYINGRVTFQSLVSPLRTDDSFKNKEDDDFHLYNSPLENLNVGLVSNWTVVEFTKDDDYREISCIPNNWVFSKNDEVFSFWPKRNIRKHIKNATPPEKQWDVWPARVMLKNSVSYKEAISFEKKNEKVTESEGEEVRSKKRKRKAICLKDFITDVLEEEEDDQIPPPPKIIKAPPSPATTVPSRSLNDILSAKSYGDIATTSGDTLSVRSLERNNNDSPATLSLGSEVNTSPQDSLIITEPCNVDDQIVDKLNEIIRKTTRVEIMVKRLLQKISNDPTHTPLHNTDSISNTCIQPFTKYRLLCEYEERLKSGEDARKELDNIFRLCGGNSTKENIKRGLRRIFDDKLARKCSWLGRKNNFQVSNLIIMDVLKNAVRKNFPLLTDKIFELTVSTWLRQANLRFTRKLEK